MSRKGHLLWAPLVVVYWGLAFVIGSAIPSVGTLSGLVAAACIFQFSYTFPPVLFLGLLMKIDASDLDEPFTTPGVAPRQYDTWRYFVSPLFVVLSRKKDLACSRIRLCLVSWASPELTGPPLVSHSLDGDVVLSTVEEIASS